ncbi:hypothetical protein EYF80_006536 [Liparis tanakae]|uniref:Uncharacterized protein n=1 Tax=Liparis tanakae TaxID=230148 RepID=A0A4Z2J170_9TELE|nr:hypothetical protein EYF80_006536 [Liparis tanakae]
MGSMMFGVDMRFRYKQRQLHKFMSEARLGTRFHEKMCCYSRGVAPNRTRSGLVILFNPSSAIVLTSHALSRECVLRGTRRPSGASYTAPQHHSWASPVIAHRVGGGVPRPLHPASGGSSRPLNQNYIRQSKIHTDLLTRDYCP